MSPPPSYEKLSKFLIDDEDSEAFIECFKLIDSAEKKEAVLFWDCYRIYVNARYNLNGDLFDAHIAPYAKNFKASQLKDLFSAASQADYPSFARYFATVLIGDRPKILQQDHASLYELLISKFKPEELAGVFNQLPDPLDNPDNDLFLQRITDARTAFNHGNPNPVQQLITQKFNFQTEPVSLYYTGASLEQLLEEGKFKEFIELFEKVPTESRVQLLAADDGIIFKSAYSKFSEQQLVNLLLRLPNELASTDDNALVRLISETSIAYKNNAQKSKLVLGKLFLRASSEACMSHDIVKLPIYIFADDFISFIKKQKVAYLISSYMSASNTLPDKTHPFYDVILSQGPDALILVLDLINKDYSDRLSSELCKNKRTAVGKEYLYETLLKYPGKHGARIAEIIAPKINDQERSSLVLRFYKGHNGFPWPVILTLLKHMQDRARLHLLLSPLADPEQTLLIESIAKEGLTPFFETLASFGDPTARFLIYTQPVKYAVTQRFSQNLMANSAVGAISSAVSWLPGLGNQAKQAVDYYQVNVDVTEFLLCRMLRSNSTLKQGLMSMLGDLKPRQMTPLLRGPDATGETLFMLIVQIAEKSDLLQVLSAAAYDVPDNQKLVDPSQLNINKMREMVRQRTDSHARVGFVALLGLYNYIAVRGTEANDLTYQTSKDEYLLMLKCLEANQASTGIAAKLKEYCASNPLRQAWSIPLASSSVMLGTNRHLDARNKLLELTIPELQQGIRLFEEFIMMRINNAPTFDLDSLDRNIHSQIKGKVGNRATSPI